MSAEADRAELIALERQRAEALIRRDAALLDALWPADLMHIHSTGTHDGATESPHPAHR